MSFNSKVALLFVCLCVLANIPVSSYRPEHEQLIPDDSFAGTTADIHNSSLPRGGSALASADEVWQKPLDVFAARTVNVPRSKERGTSFAEVGTLVRGERTIRPAAKDLRITKYSNATSELLQDAQSMSLPGKMQSAPLYILDVVALPQENSVAVFALDSRLISAATNKGMRPSSLDLVRLSPAVTDELTKLPMRLLGTTAHHTMKCATLKDKTVDGNCRGASQVLMCRVVGANIAEELTRAKRTSRPFSIQIGKDIVDVSPLTLSAASVGMSSSRHFLRAPSRHGPLRSSVVLTMHGKAPPYIDETIEFYKLMGVKHVYLGVFMEDIPGSFKQAFQPHITSGYVSLLETDRWPGLSFEAKKVSFAAKDHAEQLWPTLINDLALYYAKNFDDLLFLHDYDELIVPTGGNIKTMHVLEQILQSDNIALNDLCFLSLCPLLTYGKGRRNKMSRSADFQFMDGGLPASAITKKRREGDPLRVFCDEGGYLNIYPKSIAVVENTYKTTLHVPGACSATRHDPLDGMAVGYHKEVKRDMGLVVQHFADLFVPGRYMQRLHGHLESESAFSRLWAPKLKHSQV